MVNTETLSSKEVENESKIKKKSSLSIPHPNPKDEEIESGIKIQPHIVTKPRLTLTKPEIKKNVEAPKITMKNQTLNSEGDVNIKKSQSHKKSPFKLFSPEKINKDNNDNDDINFLTKKSSKSDLENKDYIASLTDLMSMDVNEKINLNNFDNDIKYNKYVELKLEILIII